MRFFADVNPTQDGQFAAHWELGDADRLDAAADMVRSGDEHFSTAAEAWAWLEAEAERLNANPMWVKRDRQISN